MPGRRGFGLLICVEWLFDNDHTGSGELRTRDSHDFIVFDGFAESANRFRARITKSALREFQIGEFSCFRNCPGIDESDRHRLSLVLTRDRLQIQTWFDGPIVQEATRSSELMSLQPLCCMLFEEYFLAKSLMTYRSPERKIMFLNRNSAQ